MKKKKKMTTLEEFTNENSDVLAEESRTAGMLDCILYTGATLSEKDVWSAEKLPWSHERPVLLIMIASRD